MSQLPKGVKRVIKDIQEDQVPHLFNIIKRMREGDTSIPTWISDKSEDYYEGLLYGSYTSVERILHEYGCYHGFQETEKGRVYYIS